MPLIHCPDCGGEMSNAAPMCPHCGYTARLLAVRQPLPKWVIIAAFIIFGLVIFSAFMA